MGEAALIRTVRFRARHRYWRPEWTDAENRRVFGESVESHGHDYRVQVTLRGPIDDRTGFLVDLSALDEVLEEVVHPLDGEDLDVVIPEARAGNMMSSTECLARWFWKRLAPRIPGPASLVRVRIDESDTLSAEYEG
jgi:6-pyruvoyltetrahydropterin/6-carboxytetrahydropterin synthase